VRKGPEKKLRGLCFSCRFLKYWEILPSASQKATALHLAYLQQMRSALLFVIENPLTESGQSKWVN
jgi:hypothetical protein